MNQRVKFDISDLERIGSIECLYDSERIAKEEDDKNANTDTFSRALDTRNDAFDASGIMASMHRSDVNLVKKGNTEKALRMIPSDEAQAVWNSPIREKMMLEENLDETISLKNIGLDPRIEIDKDV